MTDPDFRALCAELLQLELEQPAEYTDWKMRYNAAIARARAALAQSEPAPTNEELLELMPETMRDEFSYAAKVCSDAIGGQVKPDIFRVCLNHTALEYARAVLNRYAHTSEEALDA
jgi:lysine/ornithine N-monooxygenase